VITAVVDEKFRKERLNSQASETRRSSEPALTVPLNISRSAPRCTVGSRPASIIIIDNIDVVVVLPCVPDTLITFLYVLVKAPRNSALSKI
jgi:hypothetical protein